MSDPSVEEIVARLEGEMSAGYHATNICNDIHTLISSWRERGEAMAQALDLIKTQAQYRADHGSRSEPLPWISEAYRVIDAALAAAGHKEGGENERIAPNFVRGHDGNPLYVGRRK